MAAEGMPFPWRRDGDPNFPNLDFIWGMSTKCSLQGRGQSGNRFPISTIELSFRDQLLGFLDILRGHFNHQEVQQR